MRKFILVLALGLIGCSAHASACDNLTVWVERAECFDKTVQTAPDIAAYRRLLIERVNTGQMTNAEADYAFQQMIAEKNGQIVQQRASQPQQAPPYYIAPPVGERPVETECQPKLGGGFVCTSEPRGPDLSVFGKVKTY